jgi:hypothetical protein
MVMNMMKIKIIAAALCLTGCSYIMDSLDRAIGAQSSSFSINASYTPGSPGHLDVSWGNQEVDDKEFGGYEVYMILEPWDEFGTYHVIAARHQLVPVFGSDFFVKLTSLGNRGTHSESIYVSPAQLGGTGEYYVRVGVITMDERDKNSGGGYYSDSFKPDYDDHSSIHSISGYKAVYIH